MAKLSQTLANSIGKIMETRNIKDYDLEANWDSSLSKKENLDIILGNSEKQSLKFNKDEANAIEEKQLEEERKFIKQQIYEGIKEIKKTGIADLNIFYHDLVEMVDLVIKGFSKSLFVIGDAGLGKTTTISNLLFTDGTKAVRVGGHISPRKLYETLYNYREDYIVFFDDTESLLSNPITICLLKQGLDTHEPRIVSWDTTNFRGNVRVPEFILTSRVIFCLNSMPNDIGLKAIVDRSDSYTINFSFSDILKMMSIIANNERKIKEQILMPEIRQMIVNFISQNADITTEKLSLRTQYKIENYYAYNKDEWKFMALKLLNTKCDKLKIVDDIEKGGYAVEDKLRKWNELTGDKRTQYYYWKAELKKRMDSCLKDSKTES